MTTRRSLSLQREALADLTPEDLAGLDGAALAATVPALCFVYDPTQLRCLLTLTQCLTC